jgi:hypothetical protein
MERRDAVPERAAGLKRSAHRLSETPVPVEPDADRLEPRGGTRDAAPDWVRRQADSVRRRANGAYRRAAVVER